MTQKQLLTRSSLAISFLFHPLIIPTWGAVLLFFGHSLMSALPIGIKWFLTGVIVLNTLVAPMLCIWLLKLFHLIPDLKLWEQRYRIIPLIIVLVSYLSCSLMLSDVMMALLLRRFLYAAMACVILVLIITPFWKISLHMTAMGGLLAFLSALNLTGLGVYSYTIVIFILLAGILASARLWLGSHNLWQVIAGFVGGYLSAATLLLLL